MKLAILTFHRAFNCGAMLQAWALQTTLERMGHLVEFPNCNEVGVVKRFIPFERKKKICRQLVSVGYRLLYNLLSLGIVDLVRHRYKCFSYYLNCIDCTLEDFKARYNAIIIGSDQVWNERVSSPNTSLFLGEGIPKNLPLIAYAASMGDKVPSEVYRQRLQKALPRFVAISLRERSGVEQLQQLTQQKMDVVLDPTLLLTSKDYNTIVDEKVRLKENVLFTYAVSYTEKSIQRIREIAKALDVKIRISRPYEATLLTKPKGFSTPVSPGQLLAYTAQAKYVIPASFHGMVFALLYRKPFVIMRPQKDEYETRPAALLRQLGMLNRIVTPETPIDEVLAILHEPYPDDFDLRLNQLREQSLAWLNNALVAASR